MRQMETFVNSLIIKGSLSTLAHLAMLIELHAGPGIYAGPATVRFRRNAAAP
jgi:hypothetical protein